MCFSMGMYFPISDFIAVFYMVPSVCMLCIDEFQTIHTYMSIALALLAFNRGTVQSHLFFDSGGRSVLYSSIC